MAPTATDKNGIPLKSPYPEGIPVPALYATFQTVFLGFGGAITYAIYTFGATAKYDAKIAMIKSLDLGWVYAGLVAIKLGGFGMSVMLGNARKESKVTVPDQHVYRQHGEEKFTLMVTEGAHGRFNRAQRALCNTLEAQPYLLALFLMNGFVFPFEAACMVCAWLGCRLVGAAGYIKSANDRMGGNLLSGIIQNAFEAMAILTAYKAIAA